MWYPGNTSSRSPNNLEANALKSLENLEEMYGTNDCIEIAIKPPHLMRQAIDVTFCVHYPLTWVTKNNSSILELFYRKYWRTISSVLYA